MFPLALGAALLPAAYQGIKGIFQKGQAKNLNPDQYDYIPQGLTMNRDLAQQQAFSRRAPGTANSESMIRRSQANQINAARLSVGGDANKLAALAGQATGQANDANARVASQGQQFSEGAFGRLQGANSAIAGMQRQNYNDYWQQRNYLNQSGDQNIFNSLSNIGTAGVLAAADAGSGAAKSIAKGISVNNGVGPLPMLTGNSGPPPNMGFANKWLNAMNPGIYGGGGAYNPGYNPGYDPTGRGWGMSQFDPNLVNGGTMLQRRRRKIY